MQTSGIVFGIYIICVVNAVDMREVATAQQHPHIDIYNLEELFPLARL
jgi:hypothetical protein